MTTAEQIEELATLCKKHGIAQIEVPHGMQVLRIVMSPLALTVTAPTAVKPADPKPVSMSRREIEEAAETARAAREAKVLRAAPRVR